MSPQRYDFDPIKEYATGYLVVGLMSMSVITIAAVVQITFLVFSPGFRATGSPVILPSLLVFVTICGLAIRKVIRELLHRGRKDQRS